MTRAEIGQLCRFYLNELGTDWFSDASTTDFDLTQALAMGLERYYRETRCSMVTYTLAATASQHTYEYYEFNPLLTVAGTLTAPTNAFTLTAHGLLEGDIVHFDTADTNISIGTRYFVKYVSSSVFQIATTLGGTAIVLTAHTNHCRKVAAERLFDLNCVAFDESRLERKNVAWLDACDSKWRFADNGTPRVWIPWGERKIRLYKPPSATSNIYIEGWETPNPRLFDGDADTPPIEESDHNLIAMYAAVVVTIRGSKDEMLVRQSALYPQLEAGWRRAYQRIHNTGDSTVIFGRGTNLPTNDWPPYSDTVTTLP